MRKGTADGGVDAGRGQDSKGRGGNGAEDGGGDAGDDGDADGAGDGGGDGQGTEG